MMHDALRGDISAAQYQTPRSSHRDQETREPPRLAAVLASLNEPLAAYVEEAE
jgi:hypothetical protein